MTEAAAKYITAAVKALRAGACSQSCCLTCAGRREPLPPPSSQPMAAALCGRARAGARALDVNQRRLQDHPGSLGAMIPKADLIFFIIIVLHFARPLACV